MKQIFLTIRSTSQYNTTKNMSENWDSDIGNLKKKITDLQIFVFPANDFRNI